MFKNFFTETARHNRTDFERMSDWWRENEEKAEKTNSELEAECYRYYERISHRNYDDGQIHLYADFRDWMSRKGIPWLRRQGKYLEISWAFNPINLIFRGYLAVCMGLMLSVLGWIGLDMLKKAGRWMDGFVASYSADQRVEVYFRVGILVFAAALLVEFCGNRKFRIEILAVSAVVALLLISPVGPAVIDSFKTAIDWLRNPSLRGIDAGAEWLWEAIKEWVTAPLR